MEYSYLIQPYWIELMPSVSWGSCSENGYQYGPSRRTQRNWPSYRVEVNWNYAALQIWWSQNSTICFHSLTIAKKNPFASFQSKLIQLINLFFGWKNWTPNWNSKNWFFVAITFNRWRHQDQWGIWRHSSTLTLLKYSN